MLNQADPDRMTDAERVVAASTGGYDFGGSEMAAFAQQLLERVKDRAFRADVRRMIVRRSWTNWKTPRTLHSKTRWSPRCCATDPVIAAARSRFPCQHRIELA